MSKNKKSVKDVQDKPVLKEDRMTVTEKKESPIAQGTVKLPCPRCKKDTEGKDFCGDCGRARNIA